MSEGSSKKPRRVPRTSVTVLADGDSRKRFPTGFPSTILSIQNYWHSIISPGGKEHLTPQEFCGEIGHFQKNYRDVTNRYKAIKKKPEKSLARTIHRLTKGTQQLELIHILALAEYVRLPAGLFVFFCELVSEELQNLNDLKLAKENSHSLLKRARRAIEALDAYVETSSKDNPAFTHIYDETPGGKHMAKALALKRMVDAFNKED